MAKRNYWLDLFTGTTWQEFNEAGGNTSGFSERRWRTVQQMKPGDYLLCYLTGVMRWIGVLEVTSGAFKDSTPIWRGAEYPSRVKVRIVAALTPETAVPIFNLRNRLSMFQDLENPNRWTGYFRGSPAKWKSEDGEIVMGAVLEAQRNPVPRPFDEKKLMRQPSTALTAKEIGAVTVPDSEDLADTAQQSEEEPSLHTEMQWLLLKLGNDMGLDVWVARNDRGREAYGKRFAELPNLLDDLPLQFDEATNRTIELIDVLWLSGKSIVAAFEIESTTSIHSGLLRMADLVAMQPNLNIPLYLVAPDERRDKVFAEVNRPTFASLSPPLHEICQYISFASLRERWAQIEGFIHYLKPEFLDEISESCEVGEA